MNKYSESRSNRRIKNKRFIIDYLEQNPCQHCGEVDIRVLDFDHLPEYKKSVNVSTVIQEGNLKELITEIMKCQILCANCHRRHTAKTSNSYRQTYFFENQKTA